MIEHDTKGQDFALIGCDSKDDKPDGSVFDDRQQHERVLPVQPIPEGQSGPAIAKAAGVNVREDSGMMRLRGDDPYHCWPLTRASGGRK